jgi:hypothetical protein
MRVIRVQLKLTPEIPPPPIAACQPPDRWCASERLIEHDPDEVGSAALGLLAAQDRVAGWHGGARRDQPHAKVGMSVSHLPAALRRAVGNRSATLYCTRASACAANWWASANGGLQTTLSRGLVVVRKSTAGNPPLRLMMSAPVAG